MRLVGPEEQGKRVAALGTHGAAGVGEHRAVQVVVVERGAGKRRTSPERIVWIASHVVNARGAVREDVADDVVGIGDGGGGGEIGVDEALDAGDVAAVPEKGLARAVGHVAEQLAIESAELVVVQLRLKIRLVRSVPVVQQFLTNGLGQDGGGRDREEHALFEGLKLETVGFAGLGGLWAREPGWIGAHGNIPSLKQIEFR